MSGHSKWAQIKRQKGKNDQKRGQTFTKLSNAITIAVKQGGGITDPDQSFRLRLAVDAARSANMPKENIERAIQRAAGKEGQDLQEVLYEGFAPGGVSIIVEAATDNAARTTAEVKSIFNKGGGNFGQPGSVAYQFTNLGRIIVAKNDKTFDEIFEIAIDSGAQDIEEVGDEVFIYTNFSDLIKVKKTLEDKGLTIAEAETVREPISKIAIESPEALSKVVNFVETLEGLDDILKVYTNLE